MCKYCDYSSEDCVIFQDTFILGDWYMDITTHEFDRVDNDFVHQREYISYCPYCGRKL